MSPFIKISMNLVTCNFTLDNTGVDLARNSPYVLSDKELRTGFKLFVVGVNQCGLSFNGNQELTSLAT